MNKRSLAIAAFATFAVAGSVFAQDAGVKQGDVIDLGKDKTCKVETVSALGFSHGSHLVTCADGTKVFHKDKPTAVEVAPAPKPPAALEQTARNSGPTEHLVP